MIRVFLIAGEASGDALGAGPQQGYQGAPTICITSDAGAAYSLFELDTAIKYGLPTINILTADAVQVDFLGRPAATTSAVCLARTWSLLRMAVSGASRRRSRASSACRSPAAVSGT